MVDAFNLDSCDDTVIDDFPACPSGTDEGGLIIWGYTEQAALTNAEEVRIIHIFHLFFIMMN